MGVASRLRVDDVDGGGTPAPLVGGASRARNPFGANWGTGDVRNGGQLARTWKIYGQAFAAGTDSFKLGVYDVSTKHSEAGTQRVQAGAPTRTDTVAFVQGTNLTAAAIQAALRTATGDGGLTVTGTDNFDASGFTVTFTEPFPGIIVAHTLAGGASVQIDRGTIAYSDAGDTLTGTPGTTPSEGGIAFDQESSRGIGSNVPLGHSIVTDGTGQTAQTTLAPPTLDGLQGNNGNGTIVVTATEVSSGGTSAVVLYSVRALEKGSVPEWFVVDTEDADGDVTLTPTTAGDYEVLGHTQTAAGRVSRPWAPAYCTVT